MVGTLQEAADMLLEAEVAEMLRVHIKVIRRERTLGRLGFHRIGGQVRISRGDLNQYLAAGWHGPAEDHTSSSAEASGKSSGPTAAAALRAAARGRAIAARPKSPLPPSSSNTTSPSESR